MKSFTHKPTDAEIASAVGFDYHRAIAIRKKNTQPIDTKKILRDVCDPYMIHRADYTSVDQLISDVQFIWRINKQKKNKEKLAKAKKPKKSDQYKLML